MLFRSGGAALGYWLTGSLVTAAAVATVTCFVTYYLPAYANAVRWSFPPGPGRLAGRAARANAVAVRSLAVEFGMGEAVDSLAVRPALIYATPLWLEGLSGQLARWVTRPHLARVIRRLPKLGGSDVRDPQAKAENPCYPAIPTRGLAQLVTFMRIVDGALPLVTQPTLVIHATQDHTAPVACARFIAEHVAPSARVQLRILEQSYHLIAVDIERDIVAADVSGFLQPLRAKDTACAT